MQNNFKGKALNLIVIVEEVFNENKTASGFDLSGVVDANEKQKRGKVVSIGEATPRLSNGEHTLQHGNEIIFDKFKATPFTQDGVQYLLVDYRDIIIML